MARMSCRPGRGGLLLLLLLAPTHDCRAHYQAADHRLRSSLLAVGLQPGPRPDHDQAGQTEDDLPLTASLTSQILEKPPSNSRNSVLVRQYLIQARRLGKREDGSYQRDEGKEHNKKEKPDEMEGLDQMVEEGKKRDDNNLQAPDDREELDKMEDEGNTADENTREAAALLRQYLIQATRLGKRSAVVRTVQRKSNHNWEERKVAD